MAKKENKELEVRIEDLPIDADATLTVEQRKALVSIIDGEFERQRSRFQVQAQEQRRRTLEKYKESSGFYALKEKLAGAQHKVREVEDKIEELGLRIDGEVLTYYAKEENDKVKKARERVARLLDELSSPKDAEDRKAKVIARLWLSTTYREAVVILREVLGNGYIPPVMKK